MGSMQARDLETELVIVGAGGCGMMAAFAAASRGIELIVLEKNAKLGSNTELASGSIAAAGTRFQQALGITGTAKEMAEEVMRKNGGQADPEIVLTLCRKACEADAEYIGGAGNTGDGILWGIEIGAAVAYMTGHQGHGYVCKGYGSRLSAEIPLMGGIMVNVDGDRFVHEDQGYSEFARVVLAQPGGVRYEIFDQRIHDILIETAHFKEAADSGALRRGDTIEDLARALTLDPGRVRASFDDYNAGREKGEDRFGRKLFGEPLQPPFYDAMLTGALAHTQGGLVVDVHARVLREDRSIIPNLCVCAAASALAVHHAMQRQPLATSVALVKATGLTAATANKSLAHLERLKIVTELTSRQRGRVFSYQRYVKELAAELEATP